MKSVDDIRDDIRELVSKESLHASTGPETYEWTEAEKKELKMVLSKVFGWSKE